MEIGCSTAASDKFLKAKARKTRITTTLLIIFSTRNSFLTSQIATSALIHGAIFCTMYRLEAVS